MQNSKRTLCKNKQHTVGPDRTMKIQVLTFCTQEREKCYCL